MVLRTKVIDLRNYGRTPMLQNLTIERLCVLCVLGGERLSQVAGVGRWYRYFTNPLSLIHSSNRTIQLPTGRLLLARRPKPWPPVL
jgi:hypothetical protein